jgi:phosphate:Na+ symporter
MTVLFFFNVLGGLSLFLLGIKLMTDGLKIIAGDRMRTLLTRATQTRTKGLFLGTALGFVAHSSAATVMTVGFVNAGLLTLYSALPLVFGANIGTSLSMQLISFHLTDYALVAVAIGGVIMLGFFPNKIKKTGQAILGFGLIFLGMKLMGDAISPHKEMIGPWLSGMDSDTFWGMIVGILIAAGLTAFVQSSGAVIGIAFVLINAGAIDRLEQVYPIVLGAHIGTCVTALLGSLGTNIEAKRAALANLVFNLFNVALAVVAAPLILRLIKESSDNLVHQTANLHTAVMILAVVLLLPVTPWFAKGLRWILRSREVAPHQSFLDVSLLNTPESAMEATISELRRCSIVCRESFFQVRSLLDEFNRGAVQKVRSNEQSINEIKIVFQGYLGSLTKRYLSRRQALMVQALNRCMIEIERIGDHIDSLGEKAVLHREILSDGVDKEVQNQMKLFYESADQVLSRLVESFDLTHNSFEPFAKRIIEARREYKRATAPIRTAVTKRISDHQLSPIIGLVFSEVALTIDRIVRHCVVIASEEREPVFWIKKAKLGKLAKEELV